MGRFLRRSVADDRERAIYALICTRDGITAKEIARTLKIDKHEVNQYLYRSPFIGDLCYRDADFRWYGLIHQSSPHLGLFEFCGYFGSVMDFRSLSEDEFLLELKSGCSRIGRSLSDTRGLIHSFTDTRECMLSLFDALDDFGVKTTAWEICFEVRIRRSKGVRIYADVMVITDAYAFSLEFKMKDAIEQSEVDQAAKYAPYLEVVLGPEIEVVCALVLTRAQDLFCHANPTDTTAEVAVSSADALFNVFDEYLQFLD